MDGIFKTSSPQTDEITVMYRNPLGKTDGRNRIISGACLSLIVGLLVGAGIWYILDGNIPLGVVLEACAGVYVALTVMRIVGGVKLMRRPYAVIIDKKNLILRESDGYLHLSLGEMRRITVDCHGIEAQLGVNGDGKYDIVIKGDTMYYTLDGEQRSVASKNMRKIAFILNAVALAPDNDTNWGVRFDEILASAHVEEEGIVSGLNRELESVAQTASESDADNDENN